MDTTSGYDQYTGDGMIDDRGPAVIAAVFTDRDSAHGAAHELHDEGFRETWIGLTRTDSQAYGDDAIGNRSDASALAAAGETRIESDNWFTRFFGEGDESLSDALQRHGVTPAEARAAGPLPAHSAILTVEGSNHPELAVQIIRRSGGRLITQGFGTTGYGTAGTPAAYGDEAPSARTTSLYDDGAMNAATASAAGANATERTGADRTYANDARMAADGGSPSMPLVANDAPAMTPVENDARTSGSRVADGASAAAAADEDDATAYDDYGRYRAGKPLDEASRLQLREERLRVDKSRVSRGEATVGTEVVTETQTLDVPFVREELFVERRPAAAGTAVAANDTAIGEADVLRIPLSEEKVVVTKVPVVTEEVMVGKREIADTAHIAETTRREQLKVDDVASPVNAGSSSRDSV